MPMRPPFCPNRDCRYHVDPVSAEAAALARRGFSEQTFSLDYSVRRTNDTTYRISLEFLIKDDTAIPVDVGTTMKRIGDDARDVSSPGKRPHECRGGRCSANTVLSYMISIVEMVACESRARQRHQTAVQPEGHTLSRTSQDLRTILRTATARRRQSARRDRVGRGRIGTMDDPRWRGATGAAWVCDFQRQHPLSYYPRNTP
jgi:hypothetical protein